MGRNNKKIYNLSQNSIFFLCTYYLFLIIGGCIMSVIIGINSINYVDEKLILKASFELSISFSAVTSSIKYIRKIYIACITGKINIENNIIRSMGNFIYFFFRPLFSMAFSVLLVYALVSGMLGIIGGLEIILSFKFVYLCAVLSAVLGFSIGDVIDKFGDMSREKISRLIK